MKVSELVEIVEKETGAIFVGDSLHPMPVESREIASLDIIDHFWTDFFATVVQRSYEGKVENLPFVLEELHRIAANANAIAARLSTSEVVLVRHPHSSEIANFV